MATVTDVHSDHKMTSQTTNATKAGPTGITFGGSTFTVPETHDMVKTLFDPSVRKSYLEVIILTILCSNFLVFYLVSNNQLRIAIFVGLYIFWRLSYNFGIGFCLRQQSNHNQLVIWAEKYLLSPSMIKYTTMEIKAQRGPKYNLEDYPVEFNTWLLFRKFVDLILMSDFTTFICVVIACAIDSDYQFLSNQPTWLVASRIIVGSSFILFNLWVKVNAHNTIKDYAWYWGDFFFRQINNEDLIFDGVFEMFPHPMYSVGYIGYYGFALISKSYVVLVVAIFGHFLQMVFLQFIENPHIDKIYGPSTNEINLAAVLKLKDLRNFDNMKPLVGLFNFNWLRSSDIVNLIITVSYGITIPILGSQASKSFATGLFVLAFIIKLVESFSIDILLVLQSYYKYYTKWYLSMDIPIEKSLNNWAILYNSLINLTYSSLFGFNLTYILQGNRDFLFSDWFYLRNFLGAILILTQVWINASIIESIGYFGWFYGDFFIPKSKRPIQLTKAGVYRYLNNPEQIFGVCGVMGVFLMIPSVENLSLCLLWVANNFIRINFVERFHMIKVYGEKEVLKDSGVTKTVKKHLIPDVIRRLSNENDDLNKKRKRGTSISITDAVENLIKELKLSNAKISKQRIAELSQRLTFVNSDYKLTIDGLKAGSEDSLRYATLGNPIKVNWKSPAELHSPTNWIGLYKISQTAYARNKTLISSAGRWTPCEKNEGSYIFEKNKLFWEEGIYEFRLHLEGKHEVAYISEPFEIKGEEIEVPNSDHELIDFANTLKRVVFDNVIEIPSIEENIGKYANETPSVTDTYNKIGYIILKSTAIKISSKVLLTNGDEDGFTIKSLAKKLINIKKVLEDLSSDDLAISEIKKQI